MNNPREQIVLDQRFSSLISSLSDEDLVGLAKVLNEELREGLADLIGFPMSAYDSDAELITGLRTKSNRRMSSYNLGIILSDGCVQKCIEVLGDSSEDPTLEDLQAALPELIEEFGLAAARLMAIQYSFSLKGFKDLIDNDERFAIKMAVLNTPVLEVDKVAQDAKRAVRRERQKSQKARRK